MMPVPANGIFIVCVNASEAIFGKFPVVPIAIY